MSTYTAPLNEGLVRDIIYTARRDPSSLRFKFYAREMQAVLDTTSTSVLTDTVRQNLAAAIRDESVNGHR